jgi:hypothetical protein
VWDGRTMTAVRSGSCSGLFGCRSLPFVRAGSQSAARPAFCPFREMPTYAVQPSGLNVPLPPIACRGCAAVTGRGACARATGEIEIYLRGYKYETKISEMLEDPHITVSRSLRSVGATASNADRSSARHFGVICATFARGHGASMSTGSQRGTRAGAAVCSAWT